MLDADETFARFMVGTEPDPARFHATVDELIARACKDRLPCPVRAYGEMVDVLWKRANAEGAIRLEMLWNRVATQAQFSLLCGYAVGNFYKEVATGPTFQTVCDHITTSSPWTNRPDSSRRSCLPRSLSVRWRLGWASFLAAETWHTAPTILRRGISPRSSIRRMTPSSARI